MAILVSMVSMAPRTARGKQRAAVRGVRRLELGVARRAPSECSHGKHGNNGKCSHGKYSCRKHIVVEVWSRLMLGVARRTAACYGSTCK